MKIKMFVTRCEGFGFEGQDNDFIRKKPVVVPDISGLQEFYLFYVAKNWTFTVVINRAHVNYHISYYSIDGPLVGFN
jgi:hypothetical protein